MVASIPGGVGAIFFKEGEKMSEPGGMDRRLLLQAGSAAMGAMVVPGVAAPAHGCN